MHSDPIVDEVRRVRLEIEREIGRGRKAFYRHALKLQKGLGDRLVYLGPQRLPKELKGAGALKRTRTVKRKG